MMGLSFPNLLFNDEYLLGGIVAEGTAKALLKPQLQAGVQAEVVESSTPLLFLVP